MKNTRKISAILVMIVLTLTTIAGCVQKGAKWKDGTYKGEGKGKGGKIVVEVKVAGGKIDGIKVLEHNETPGYFEPARDKILDEIKTQNKTNVKPVSGATLTSKGLIAAVNDALKKAK